MIKLADILKETKPIVSSAKVVCKNCGHSWEFTKGGDDPYICHKCFEDNKPKKVNKK